MTSDAPLKDQAQRERFIRELDKNFCVSAGAGVGKTTAIVERVAQITLRDPRALPRLVVVTYTHSAADELCVRARERVLEQLSGAAHLRRDLLADFRCAFFGTIHSFCLKLVRENGRALGLPATVDLLEENDEADFWQRFCESRALDEMQLPERLLDAVSRFLSFADLLALARQIDREHGAETAEKIVRDFVEQPQPDVNFLNALADDGGRSPRNTSENQRQLREWLREWRDGAPFLKLPDFKSGSGSFKKAFADEIASLASWPGNAAARLAAQISLGYREFRREQRRLTYADQISWCRKLIENPRILDRMREREWIVILDEAQDTDAGMFSILAELTRPRGATIDEWPRIKQASGPEPGRFCFVGDEQQSIFASRASLATYREYVDAFAEKRGGEALEFSVTMRCSQRVIDLVNATFFANARLRQTHLFFRELHAKPRCEPGAAWLLPIAPAPDDMRNVEALFDFECEQVAKFLLDYKPHGLGVWRWSDVAILCPRHRWLARAHEIFSRAGIPCRLVAEKKTQLEIPQRSWPAALFYVLLNPWDRFELIGVLREIFCVSDVELADAQSANRPFGFFSNEKLSLRLASSMELLRKMRRAILQNDASGASGARTLSRFVDFVLDETRLAARLDAVGELSHGLDALRHGAMRAECDGRTLREWSSALSNDLAKSADAVADVIDEMPILTSQKAKGLEWPVVIPLGLGRAIYERHAHFPRIERHGTKVVAQLSATTADRKWDEDREQKRREEIQRLFYVSLTRAKSLLLLPDSARLYKKSKSEKASFLELCKWGELDCAKILQSPAPRISQPQAADEKKSREFKQHAARDLRVIEQAVKSSRDVPRWISTIERGQNQRIDLPENEIEIGGADYGMWWHRMMARFPWRGDATEQRGFLEKALRGAPSHFQKRAARDAEASAMFRAELQKIGGRFLADVPFSFARSEREWIDGMIDLVVIARGSEVRDSRELWLLDWRVEQCERNESVDAFRERLLSAALPALEMGAEVLRDGFQRGVTRLVIFSNELGSAIYSAAPRAQA